MFQRGDIVWGKMKGYCWWPAIILDATDCNIKYSNPKKCWLFWFGDHSISEIYREKLTPFKEHFIENSSNNRRKKFLKAVEEAVIVVAAANNLKCDDESLVQWGKKNLYSSSEIKFRWLQADLPKLVQDSLSADTYTYDESDANDIIKNVIQKVPNNEKSLEGENYESRASEEIPTENRDSHQEPHAKNTISEEMAAENGTNEAISAENVINEEIPTESSSSQMTDSIFPPYIISLPDDEWWNSVPTVSVTDQHSDVKPTRLDKVKQHDVPCKFRVLATVFSFKPNTASIEKFINLCCSKCNYISEVNSSLVPFEERDGLCYYYCPVCKDGEDDPGQWPVLEYTFMLSLILFDGFSSIEAYLWKENAVKFFKGITPEEALRDSGTADSILHMLWNICPNCRPSNFTLIEHSYVHPPTLDCCIFSYIGENETFYQIFDTVLI